MGYAKPYASKIKLKLQIFLAQNMKDMIKYIADFLSGHIGLVSGLCAGLIVYFGNMRKTKGNEFKLYSLMISAGEIEEWHNVGLLAAYKLAEETGERYHKKIGSKNNPCKYQAYSRRKQGCIKTLKQIFKQNSYDSSRNARDNHHHTEISNRSFL